MFRRTFIAVALFFAITSSASAQLLPAVKEGSVERVKQLLEAGINPNLTFTNGVTAIFFADKPEIIDLLIAHGARLDLRDSALIQTPIERAAENSLRDVDRRETWKLIVKKLREGGAEYTIDTAIYLNDVEFVIDLLKKDASWVNQRKDAQQVPLERAAGVGRVEICKLLLEHGADPDKGSGWPVVVHAVRHPEILKLLIDHGVNLKRRISWHGGRSGIWLIEDEATALHFAAEVGNVESVKLLLEAGLDPSATESEGRTPLHVALSAERFFSEDGKLQPSYLEVVRILLENDASLRLEDRQEHTVAELAKSIKSPRSIRRLIHKKQRELDERLYNAVFQKTDK